MILWSATSMKNLVCECSITAFLTIVKKWKPKCLPTDKSNMISTYSGVLLDKEKEWSPDTC